MLDLEGTSSRPSSPTQPCAHRRWDKALNATDLPSPVTFTPPASPLSPLGCHQPRNCPTQETEDPRLLTSTLPLALCLSHTCFVLSTYFAAVPVFTS